MGHFYKAFLFLFISFLIAQVCEAQKSSLGPPPSNDPSYGYTVGNPILMKNGKYEKSYRGVVNFLSGLKTPDGQDLIVVERYSYVPSTVECYVLMSSITGRKVNIFIDPNKKGRIQLPIGLVFEEPVVQEDEEDNP